MTHLEFAARLRELAVEASRSMSEEEISSAMLGVATKAFAQANDPLIAASFLQAQADVILDGGKVEDHVRRHMRRNIRKVT